MTRPYRACGPVFALPRPEAATILFALCVVGGLAEFDPERHPPRRTYSRDDYRAKANRVARRRARKGYK